MTTKLSVLPIVLALVAPACALPDDSAGEPETSETDSALAASSWSGNAYGAPETWHGAQVGTVNGTTIMVTVGNCGAADCYPFGYDDNSLHWRLRNADGSWGEDHDMGDQAANTKVSMAAFNGYLYMVHTGGDNSGDTWITHFNPTTQSWSSNYKISYPSFSGPPAIAAFNNRLYFIGTTNTSPYRMWYGSMDTAESFSPRYYVPGHETAGRISATVGFGKLWFSHRWGQTGDVVYGTFDGTTWSGVNHIYGGANNGALQAYESSIAYDANYVHLIHRRPGEKEVWWTYFNGCQWASSEVTLPNQQSDQEPSLAQGGPGLVLLGSKQHLDLFTAHDYDYVTWRSFTRPIIIRPCTVGNLPVFN